jgi:hypothetical protein
MMLLAGDPFTHRGFLYIESLSCQRTSHLTWSKITLNLAFFLSKTKYKQLFFKALFYAHIKEYRDEAESTSFLLLSPSFSFLMHAHITNL